MPSAFNPWSDLRSYSIAAMEQDLTEVRADIGQNANARPVIILEAKYARCLEYLEELKWSVVDAVPAESAQDMAAENAKILQLLEEPKWQMIMEFMNRFAYRQTFRNEKFAIYDSTLCNGNW